MAPFENLPDPDELPRPLWIFGYGSLMWRPDFTPAERRPATVWGYHRAFCITSIHWRGTPEEPGLVLGLAQGGSCRGIALKVAAGEERQTVAALRERELISYVYREVLVPARLDDGRQITVLTYAALPGHDQFAGGKDMAAQARIIARAAGVGGTNRDYLAGLITHLDALGIRRTPLHKLHAAVEALTVVTRK